MSLLIWLINLTSLWVEASQIVLGLFFVLNNASSMLIQKHVPLIINKSSSSTIPFLAFDKKFV
jgi:hypothetical protein